MTATKIIILTIIICLSSCRQENKPDFGQYKEQFVEIRDKKQFYLSKGAGQPTVVFLAGLGSTMDTFFEIQDSISKTTRTICYDRAGIGKSEPLNNERNLENICTELKEILDKIGLNKSCILVAHSRGGLIARYFTSKYPEMVCGLILVNKETMKLTAQIAKHLTDVHFGGNWTVSNLRDTLANVTWQQATTKVDSLNTIAALTYHVNYFVSAALKVLQGGPLDSKDKYSFDHPPIQSQQDWQKLLDKTWADAETFASLAEQLPESKLWEDFEDKKYGNYYRNIHGIIEHTHYHLGQIALIKKMLLQTPIH